MKYQLAHQQFLEWSKNNIVSLEQLFPTVKKTEAIHIDLSKNNTTVKTEKEFNNPKYFGGKLDEIQKDNPNKIIAGGYLEKRALYTSDIYNAKDTNEKRNVHLGIDFWLPTHTPIHSIFDGKVICSVYQKPFKGYGGFIILEHQIKGVNFYTLYGHLSKESVYKNGKGAEIKAGEQIGVLGTYAENGEWVPHLHFQVMLDLLNYENDFPGVALEKEIGFWKLVCPNPNFLFQLDTLN